MTACWTEPQINFDGRFWQLHEASMEPKPVQKPHPPIWIGGSHPAALRRAVRRGHGFFGAGSQTTEKFAEQVQIVREELSRQGRDPASFEIAKRVYIHVDDDQERADERPQTASLRVGKMFTSAGGLEESVQRPHVASAQSLKPDPDADLRAGGAGHHPAARLLRDPARRVTSLLSTEH